jgi:hypothetical protein
MYDCELKGMAEFLVKEGLVKQQDVGKAHEALGRFWAGKIAITWNVEDVQSVDEDLTDEEAEEVLDWLLHNHDASIGVNWGSIESAIHWALDRPGEPGIK